MAPSLLAALVWTRDRGRGKVGTELVASCYQGRHLMRLPVVPAPHPKLPCFPCPHRSACCSWGVSLTDSEAANLRDLYGDHALVRDEEENEWRTSAPNE